MRGRPEAQAREGRRDVGGANGMPRPDRAAMNAPARLKAPGLNLEPGES